MKNITNILITLLILTLVACTPEKRLSVEAFETSAGGNKMTPVRVTEPTGKVLPIKLLPEQKFQTITGFGGSFTEASAYLLNKLGPENRKKIIGAYFGSEGARYSLTRTHMNSCDFSVSNYSYAPVEGDMDLRHFCDPQES